VVRENHPECGYFAQVDSVHRIWHYGFPFRFYQIGGDGVLYVLSALHIAHQLMQPFRADLLEDLEFHLIVFHPYRSLINMTGRDSGPVAVRETMLDMEDNVLQMAW
jgi:hypothetical protein